MHVCINVVIYNSIMVAVFVFLHFKKFEKDFSTFSNY